MTDTVMADDATPLEKAKGALDHIKVILADPDSYDERHQLVSKHAYEEIDRLYRTAQVQAAIVTAEAHQRMAECLEILARHFAPIGAIRIEMK